MDKDTHDFLVAAFGDFNKYDPMRRYLPRYTRMVEERALRVITWWKTLSETEHSVWQRFCYGWSTDSANSMFAFSDAFTSEEILAGHPWIEFRHDVWSLLHQIGFIYWRDDYGQEGREGLNTIRLR